MTTLIKNVLVVDGTGNAPFKADVLIREPFIAAIGNFPAFKADEVLFGNEQFLSSGFVDLNTSSDRTLALFSNPACGDFLQQGITTMLVGQCGFSLAPSLYGTLHAHQSREDRYHMNCSWKTFKDFLDVLSKQYRFGINIGSLAGHRVMREDILHNPKEFRKLSAEELRIFRHVLSKALEDGAFGFSTGLGYIPYAKTPYHELRALADAVVSHKGLYATHMRNETDDVLNSVKEVATLAQDTSVRTVISHLRPFVGYEEQFEKAVEFLERRFAKAHVYFDINPFPYSAVRVDAFLPKRMQTMDRDAACAIIHDPAMEKELLEHLPSINTRDAVIFRAYDMPFLRGVSLSSFGRNRHVSSRKALLEFMRVTKLRGVLFYKNLNSTFITKGILSPQSLISTNSSHSADTFDKLSVNPEQSRRIDEKSFRPSRTVKTFPEFIRIANSSGMSVEKAVAKITATPASLMGLEKRGTVAAGFYADLTLFSKDGSISNVFVNGRRVVQDGQLDLKKATSGAVLRKKK